MSANHNIARRHRQIVKKRATYDAIKERSPPPSQIFGAPTQGIPPVGTDTPPDQPGGRPPGVPARPPPTATPPRQTPPGQQSRTVPQVPVPTVQTTPLVPTVSVPTVTPTVTTSSILTPSTPPVIPTSTTPLAPTNTAPALSNSIVLPSVSADGLASTPSASATDTSDGLGTGSIVGIVAAGLVAVAAVVVVGMWLTKRYFRKRDQEEFDRNSFIRHSVHIPDGDDYASPRPPTMIERHRGAHSPSYASSGMYPPVPPVPSYQPGDVYGMANQAPAVNPFGNGHAEYNPYGQPALVRVSSNGSGHHYPGTTMSPPPGQGQYQQYPDQGHHQMDGYTDLQRTSVTPYQAAQYAEISRQLNISSVANSPVNPTFAQGQGYPAPGHPDLSLDTSHLPPPAPVRMMSPAVANSPQRVMTPSQRAMSPGGGYSFPAPIGAPPVQAPASVAHAAALAALGHSPSQVAANQQTHLQPGTQHGQNQGRVNSVYDENDAYGGM